MQYRAMRISRSIHISSNPKTVRSSMNLCFAVFCKFLGGFGGYLGGDSFSQWRRFNAILKLEFEVKN